MSFALTIGDRYYPKNTVVNNQVNLNPGVSVATVCLINDGKVSVYIDKVPGYYSLQVVMPLDVFAANFEPARGLANLANSHRIITHYTRVYPTDFIKSNKKS